MAADKERAHGATTTINIGSVGTLAGNLGTGNTAGAVSVRGMDFGPVRELISQLAANAEALAAAGADGTTLKARLDLLEAEMRKPAPAAPVLRGLLVDIRNAVAGATGNLMATGAIALINQMLGTGVPVPT